MLEVFEGQKEGHCEWSRVRRRREAGEEAGEITGAGMGGEVANHVETYNQEKGLWILN